MRVLQLLRETINFNCAFQYIVEDEKKDFSVAGGVKQYLMLDDFWQINLFLEVHKETWDMRKEGGKKGKGGDKSPKISVHLISPLIEFFMIEM